MLAGEPLPKVKVIFQEYCKAKWKRWCGEKRRFCRFTLKETRLNFLRKNPTERDSSQKQILVAGVQKPPKLIIFAHKFCSLGSRHAAQNFVSFGGF